MNGIKGIMNSVINTIRHASTDTVKRLAPFQASTIAKTKAIAPENGELVASIIAGKVIAASVT